jgi:hypothetical protein
VVGKMTPIDFLDAGFPQTPNLLKKKKKSIYAKRSKMKYACTGDHQCGFQLLIMFLHSLDTGGNFSTMKKYISYS